MVAEPYSGAEPYYQSEHFIYHTPWGSVTQYLCRSKKVLAPERGGRDASQGVAAGGLVDDEHAERPEVSTVKLSLSFTKPTWNIEAPVEKPPCLQPSAGPASRAGEGCDLSCDSEGTFVSFIGCVGATATARDKHKRQGFFWSSHVCSLDWRGVFIPVCLKLVLSCVIRLGFGGIHTVSRSTTLKKGMPFPCRTRYFYCAPMVRKKKSKGKTKVQDEAMDMESGPTAAEQAAEKETVRVALKAKVAAFKKARTPTTQLKKDATKVKVGKKVKHRQINGSRKGASMW
ncbi:hypothetical protein CYMTET_18240 [Cymbomonas tetramitiformis]|uniref:Uncharacterized protein n=1 Tax=Cymbomonas tetramitiformis TaxID=36881 RepID=A0AAE0G8I3_9CHLO|nr:hypothetical protein CYMTET_18240 [Cymbomonas tetramitiformis]